MRALTAAGWKAYPASNRTRAPLSRLPCLHVQQVLDMSAINSKAACLMGNSITDGVVWAPATVASPP